MEKLREAQEEHTFLNVWTHDGKILSRDDNDQIKVHYINI